MVEEEKKDESPASWRLGLRKTGSYGALSEITATKDAQREKDTTGVMRSASSPRLSSTLDNKEKEKVLLLNLKKYEVIYIWATLLITHKLFFYLLSLGEGQRNPARVCGPNHPQEAC